MPGPGLIKTFILLRPGPEYDFHGTFGDLGGFYEIFVNFMKFLGILWIFIGK